MPAGKSASGSMKGSSSGKLRDDPPTCIPRSQYYLQSRRFFQIADVSRTTSNATTMSVMMTLIPLLFITEMNRDETTGMGKKHPGLIAPRLTGPGPRQAKTVEQLKRKCRGRLDAAKTHLVPAHGEVFFA